MTWLELVALKSEAELQQALATLQDDERAVLVKTLSRVTNLEPIDRERGALRLLVERARPFAISATSWKRPVWSSDPPEPAIEAHLRQLGEAVDLRLVQDLKLMQARFASTRHSVSGYKERLLERQDYRCALCGLRYYNDELTSSALVSPYHFRRSLKHDPLKPHWSRSDLRSPTVDHVWPVTVYGDNDISNLQAVCNACNAGKANFSFLEQTVKHAGMVTSDEVHQGLLPISSSLFVAQMWRQPRCVETGHSAREAELTVRVRDARFATVLDNLETIASPD